MIKILLLNLLIVLNMVSMYKSFNLNRNAHINIINDLQNNLDLTLHSKSGDDDLGEHVLSHGNQYSMYFNVNFFGGTLFFCRFNWKGVSQKFDIYHQSRDDCRICTWRIKETGPCVNLTRKIQCNPWME